MSNKTPGPLLDLMAEYRARANHALSRYLPSPHIQPKRLHDAMRYGVLNGGKRIRAILVYLSGTLLGGSLDHLDRPASAVEMIHAYSLIHDDLPGMDNDDLRRGKPSCHRAFDEGMAILAGDALQSQAFYLLADMPAQGIAPEHHVEMVRTLALACSSRGMAGGQAMDLAGQGKRLTLVELENMHIHKTGALIHASVRLGGLAMPKVDWEGLRKLEQYARCIGLSFQIQDDILDIEGETALLGKQCGADKALDKITYPALVGMSQAKRMAAEFHEQAIDSLKGWDERADSLRQLSEYIITRSY